MNVKWYLKREGLLARHDDLALLAYYLVLTGQKEATGESRTLRPWSIESVYLFNSSHVLAEQAARGVKVGIASSMTTAQWTAAEVYPTPTNQVLRLRETQRSQLSLFASS